MHLSLLWCPRLAVEGREGGRGGEGRGGKGRGGEGRGGEGRGGMAKSHQYSLHSSPSSELAALTTPVMVTISPGTHESTRSEVNSHSMVLGIRPASLLSAAESSCTLAPVKHHMLATSPESQPTHITSETP